MNNTPAGIIPVPFSLLVYRRPNWHVDQITNQACTGSYKIVLWIPYSHNWSPDQLALTWNFRMLSSCSFVGSVLLLWPIGVAAIVAVLAGTWGAGALFTRRPSCSMRRWSLGGGTGFAATPLTPGCKTAKQMHAGHYIYKPWYCSSATEKSCKRQYSFLSYGIFSFHNFNFYTFTITV